MKHKFLCVNCKYICYEEFDEELMTKAFQKHFPGENQAEGELVCNDCGPKLGVTLDDTA